MAHFALLWKARTIEKYRLNYEKEKIKSITLANVIAPRKSLYQKFTKYQCDAKKRMSKVFRRYIPEGSLFSNFLINLRTDQTFPNFVLKSVLGFVGGIVLTYLFFMFFVFQLAVSLMHATIMSSIIGVLLTLGLAFSYRVRCLVFLLIPQFFSRVGRYTLTCYALVLILTGPATNTLKNSEVLSESMACSQEQLKNSMNKINESSNKPLHSMKDTIKIMIDKVQQVATNIRNSLLRIHRLSMSVASVLKSSFFWLNSVVEKCNFQVGSPHARCVEALEYGLINCITEFDIKYCNLSFLADPVCKPVRRIKSFCELADFFKGTLMATIHRRVKGSVEQVKNMLQASVSMHHSYSFSSNASRSASQVAAGVVTEIRSRADPLLTWLSWSSCITSLFFVLIIFRAKNYQHMFEIRSHFDNRYVTKDLRDLNLQRARQNRPTILPLNRREKAKYVTTTSFRLVASERRYLTRSAIFMTMTTFKLLIHMIADYSLYWVLMTIRYHGRFQSPLQPGVPESGVQIVGNSSVASILRAFTAAMSAPISTPAPSPVPCLPNPNPPDLQRYAQIGILIFLLWFFALFEPYGLRMRHVIMGLYRPKKAKARAVWLFNHILRARAGFLKHARRKQHRDYKYNDERKLTFRYWVKNLLVYKWLRFPLVFHRNKPHCLLCDITENLQDVDSYLQRCATPDCPGIYCCICYKAIGQMCTICMSPAEYGDISDVSFEKGSSDENSGSDSEHIALLKHHSYKQLAQDSSSEADDSDSSAPRCSKVNKRSGKHLRSKQYKRTQDRVIQHRSDISRKCSRKSNFFYVSEKTGSVKVQKKLRFVNRVHFN